MRKLWSRFLIVVFLNLGFAVGAWSQEEEPAISPYSVRAGLDLTTKYIFRGILQEDQGVIAEPWGEIDISLGEEGDALEGVDLTLGVWSSFHSGPTGSGSGGTTSDPKAFYEIDWYAGLGTTIGDRVSVGALYVHYVSPNDSFATIQEIDFSLGFDDSDLWGTFDAGGFAGLQPAVTIAFELDNEGDGGGDEGVYAEIGVTPSFAPIPDSPFTLSVPLTVGLSLDDYYQDATGSDDTFGFFDVGFVGTLPVKFLPSRYGSWELSFGVHFLSLGNHTEEINHGKGFNVIGTAGLTLSL